MASHCTFRAGGPAAYFVTADTRDELTALIEFLEDSGEKYFILGNGSNILVSDKGYDGVMIRLGKAFEDISRVGDRLIAGSAAPLVRVSVYASDCGLSGLEFASGIPGSIGGAVYMNAGAYGGEIKQILEYADILYHKDGHSFVQRKSAEELDLSYRHSSLKEYAGTVLEASFVLKEDDKALIKQRMDELKIKRQEKQPLEYGSAGSTFKRPEGYFAGKLIEDSGLRGASCGDACVSEKHCGFIVNKGKASASEIYRLMCEVQEKVRADHGVSLEPEVILLGDFAD
ncbi:MAG: UDP-N-acetylmuramate dehydrogenase [Lachnospiraceae bacterium]|nr:UDP-N-acetylmuramate dehydrogenase [Lachnospiraceae bacterium]